MLRIAINRQILKFKLLREEGVQGQKQMMIQKKVLNLEEESQLKIKIRMTKKMPKSPRNLNQNGKKSQNQEEVQEEAEEITVI